MLVVVTAVVATPWGDRLERRHPFALPLALAGLGMLAWQEVLFPPVPHMQGSALVVSWLFCLGWAAAKASGAAQRLVVTAVAVPSIGTFSGNPRRDLLTLAAALLLVWVPDAAGAPRFAVPAVTVLAASSLFVYVAALAGAAGAARHTLARLSPPGWRPASPTGGCGPAGRPSSGAARDRLGPAPASAAAPATPPLLTEAATRVPAR